MSIKSTVADDYLAITKSKFLDNPNPPERRRAAVIGWAPGNIGDAIAAMLCGQGMEVHCFTHDDIPAGNLTWINGTGERPLLADVDTIVFNNGQTHLAWIEDQSINDIMRVMNNCLVQSTIGASQFVKATMDRPYRKNIVFVGSMAYRNVLNGSAPYCAAKAGLAMLTRCLAWELAPKNYDVFCVHPSNVEGAPMSEQTIRELMEFRGISREAAEAYWSASLPREAWLQPDDIAKTVAWLVGGSASYLSGCNMELGGGQR